VEGILTPGEVERLVQRASAHGGAVSYKDNSDGTQSPYELNINYFDALSDPAADEPLEVQVRRFIASQAIQLALVGVPGIYIHSLLGSRNWPEGVQQTGIRRAINREKLDVREVEAALNTPGSRRQQVFDAYRQLITIRTGQRAFHPNAAQQVIRLDPALFVLVRTSPDGGERIAAIHNVSNRGVSTDLRRIPLDAAYYDDLVSGQRVPPGVIEIAPYQVLWLKAGGSR
jgi:sucrose phosphorylase